MLPARLSYVHTLCLVVLLGARLATGQTSERGVPQTRGLPFEHVEGSRGQLESAQHIPRQPKVGGGPKWNIQ
jgi:hypothetical protein